MILGLCIFVTFRFFVPDGADGEGHHRDVRSYLVLKRGQVVPPSAARRRASGPTARNEYRFRICGETSALAQGISSGETFAAVVQRDALVDLDPRKHSVAHALTHMDVEASSQQGATPLSALVVATMAQTPHGRGFDASIGYFNYGEDHYTQVRGGKALVEDFDRLVTSTFRGTFRVPSIISPHIFGHYMGVEDPSEVRFYIG